MTITFTDEDGRKYKLTGQCSAYNSGNTWGPPESCEPPSGGELEEIEFVELLYDEENKECIETAFEERLKTDTKLYEKVEAAFTFAAAEMEYDDF